MKKSINVGIFFALLAAGLYALNFPLSKLLLSHIPSTLTAGFLYIGAGIGMGVIGIFRKGKSKDQKLSKEELPYVIAMILLDVLAPICLLWGLKSTTAGSASLLNNFEIVATAIVALLVFGEKISFRLWIGIFFVTFSCALISVDDLTSLTFSYGSLFILLACVCWGFENNCTRKLSTKDPLQIVLIKGLCSGTGSIIIGFVIGEKIVEIWCVFAVLALGFVAYGLSIFFYVHAQRLLGATRTSAYYAVAPFIGVLLSFLIFLEIPSITFFIALGLMVVGAWLCSKDEPLFKRGKCKTCQKKEIN